MQTQELLRSLPLGSTFEARLTKRDLVGLLASLPEDRFQSILLTARPTRPDGVGETRITYRIFLEGVILEGDFAPREDTSSYLPTNLKAKLE